MEFARNPQSEKNKTRKCLNGGSGGGIRIKE